jgi:diguanylate cyclase (GGDEF)-like protein/PAS domain S-box-containing protein
LARGSVLRIFDLFFARRAGPMIDTDFAELSDTNVLRHRAETILLEQVAYPSIASARVSPGQTVDASHEFRVQQITLELQNEELHNTRVALEASRARYLDLYELAPVGYCTVDTRGMILRENQKAASLLGLPRSALQKQRFSNFIVSEDKCKYAELLALVLASRQPQDSELRILNAYGAALWINLATSLSDGEDGVAVVRVVLTDIAARKQAESEMRRAASVFTHSAQGIMITNRKGTIVEVNDAFSRITGYSRKEVLNRNPRLLGSRKQDRDFYRELWKTLTTHGQWSGEVWSRRRCNEVFAGLLTVNAVCDANGDTQQYVALFSDITALKENQRHLERIAHFDALTNLPNRLLLAQRLQLAIAQAQPRNQIVAVAYLDLDGFKVVNDRYGHDVGDKLLIHMAAAMKASLREGDTLARIGGDEFVAVLTGLDNTESCLPMLTRLLDAAVAKVQIDGVMLQASVSIGVSYYPQGQEIEPEQLLRQADQAMYQAKLAGKNRYQIFDAAQDCTLRAHHESLDRIGLALARGEFVLHFQPKVNMVSGQIIGVEALIRWQHPEKGLLAPASFLPEIESHPLAVSVGEWVIDTALAQMEIFHASALDVPVSVNIGARQLQQPDFAARLREILANHPEVNPANLELEVVETSALADLTQVSQVIENCQRMGVKFALDDFGTGYSSLTYLKRLPVEVLKIDQSFVCNMLDDPEDLTILKGVIALAKAFKRKVIAEGVETVEHGTALLQLGCALAQGYGIARPMPAGDFPAWAATWQPHLAWQTHPAFSDLSDPVGHQCPVPIRHWG